MRNSVAKRILIGFSLLIGLFIFQLKVQIPPADAQQK